METYDLKKRLEDDYTLRKLYPDWDTYDNEKRKELAQRHGCKYYSKTHDYESEQKVKHGIFQEVFDDEEEAANTQYWLWLKDMMRRYPTFRVLEKHRQFYIQGFVFWKLQIIVTYRIWGDQ